MNTAIGVIQKQSSPAEKAPTGVSSAAAFTQGLAGRYASHAILASSADLALAFESDEVNQNYYRSEHHWSLHPITAVDHKYQLFVDGGSALRPRRETTSSAEDRTSVIRLFERIFTRNSRVASFDAPFTAAAAATSGTSAGSPLPGLTPTAATTERFLPRAGKVTSTGVATPGMPANPHSPPTDSGWGTPATFHESPKPLTLPAPEIRRVADQVMREIDSRIVARRERMGGR